MLLCCYNHLYIHTVFTYFIISTFAISLVCLSIFYTLDVNAVNIMIGTTNTTTGTIEDDVIVGCSYLNPECSQGTLLFGLEGDDSLQGSSADDSIFGDKGNDAIIGTDGNDKIFGGRGNDVLQGGFGGDFLFGGDSNDELYTGAGDDVLVGGAGADYFDCGEGYDIIIDFNPVKGDTKADNCEVALSHNQNDIQFICDVDGDSRSLTSSFINSTISLSNISAENIPGFSPEKAGFTCDKLGEDMTILSYSSSSSHQAIHTQDYKALTNE